MCPQSRVRSKVIAYGGRQGMEYGGEKGLAGNWIGFYSAHEPPV